VTVLFADLVGFTALAEDLDPEHVKRQVDRCFVQLTRDITSFGGVVDKIIGDEIVALFGAPVAHEDDAERAVRAALRMQQSLAIAGSDSETPFRMRIGINTGEVLVGSSAAGRDYTAIGDVMNTASRLQTMAEPGQVVVGGTTYGATRDAISYDPLGFVAARGRSGHVEAWIARSAIRPPGSRTRRSVRFVGRHHELAVLDAQVRLAIDLHRAQLAVLYADAGMGKSRLAEELANRVAYSDGASVFRGRCVPYGEANVWWPIAEVLRQLFGIDVDSGPEEAQQLIHGRLGEFGLPESTDIGRLTTAALHALGYSTPLRNGNRDRNRAEVTLMVSTIFETELERRPLVVLLSDMHWAAEAVWGLVQHVLSHLARHPLMVVLTARRTPETVRCEGRFGSLTLELGPLELSAARELVAELDVALSPADVDDLIERSGGNPFFLEELADVVGRQGLVALGEHGRDSASGLGQIPDTLRGLLAARLDQLDANARRALEAAAVIGRTGQTASIGLMLAGTGFDGDVKRAIADLVDADIVTIDGSRFTFRSDLIREVAYGTITKASRARSHERIARYLEEVHAPNYRNSVVAAIARHYRAAAELARELGSSVPAETSDDIVERAAHWLGQSGWRALESGVPVEAEEWFGAAIDVARGIEQGWMIYGRAKARGERRDAAGARSDLDRLDALDLPDSSLRAKALVVRGDIEAKAGDLDQSVASLTAAITQLHGLGDLAEESGALRRLGMTDMLQGDYEAAKSSLELARRVAADAGERREEAWALQSLAVYAYQTGRIAEASSFVDSATEIFGELDDRAGLSWTLGLGAWVAFHQGDWTKARALVAEVLPETRRRGDPWAEAIMMILEASMSLWSGESRIALDIAREAQGVAERAEDFSLAVQARAIEGRALVTRGRIAEGFAVLEQSAALADRAGDDETRRIAIVSNCAAAARVGDTDRAIRWAARFDGLRKGPGVVGAADLSVSLAIALLQQGSVDAAADQLGWALDAEDDRARGRVNTFAMAISAAIASASGDLGTARERIACVFDGEPTYLDRVLAHLADAAVSERSGDGAASHAAIEAARVILAGTDDRVSPMLVSLVEAIIERSDLRDVEAQIRSLGIDPTGWRRAWTLVARGVDAPV
jgi:class 3 adenylate cyclase/tetratricopeptide (TPR) repeat protein